VNTTTRNIFRHATSHSRKNVQEKTFDAAVEQLEREFSGGAGIMADREKISVEFIERRLLDKLMFWEGFCLREKTFLSDTSATRHCLQ
jgi:hypothetical protein